PSNHDRRIAAAIAPSMRAAGRRINSKAATQTADAARSAVHWIACGVWRSVKGDIRSSGAKGEGVAVRYPGDAGEDIPHCPLMWLDGQARRHVGCDDQLVAKLPCLPCGRLDADMRRDAAENDRADATVLELGIEVGHEKRAPGRLGDQEVARA